MRSMPISQELRRKKVLKKVQRAAERGEPREDVVEYLAVYQSLPEPLKSECLQAYDERLRALAERH